MQKRTEETACDMQLSDATIQAMAKIITRWTAGTPDYVVPGLNLSLFQRVKPTLPAMCLLPPSIEFVLQGAKQMTVGEETYPCNSQNFLITSLDLPVTSQVIAASSIKPCLSLTLRLNLRTLTELTLQSRQFEPAEQKITHGIGSGVANLSLLDPVYRLLGLLDEPEAIPVIGPLIEREIHYRLLLSAQAPRLWQIASSGSQSHRVARAISWLIKNYASTLKIDDLAAYVQMSNSSLHHHFRQLTAMSPLQYQKWLRLTEARRLMLSEGKDAASAAFLVGYDSPSQFSREYARLFGQPPRRDVLKLRGQAVNHR